MHAFNFKLAISMRCSYLCLCDPVYRDGFVSLSKIDGRAPLVLEVRFEGEALLSESSPPVENEPAAGMRAVCKRELHLRTALPHQVPSLTTTPPLPLAMGYFAKMVMLMLLICLTKASMQCMA
jgi:hypothetical protein